MKVLLVNGSYHEHGCTATALNEVAKALNDNGVETEIYWIGQNAVNGCKGCWSCKKTKKCVIDDGVNEFVVQGWRGNRDSSGSISRGQKSCFHHHPEQRHEHWRRCVLGLQQA